jgi:hypothetical protein
MYAKGLYRGYKPGDRVLVYWSALDGAPGTIVKPNAAPNVEDCYFVEFDGDVSDVMKGIHNYDRATNICSFHLSYLAFIPKVRYSTPAERLRFGGLGV